MASTLNNADWQGFQTYRQRMKKENEDFTNFGAVYFFHAKNALLE